MAAVNTVNGVNLNDLNYTVKIPYDGVGPQGGNPLNRNLNLWYEVSLSAGPCVPTRRRQSLVLTRVTNRAATSPG